MRWRRSVPTSRSGAARSRSSSTLLRKRNASSTRWPRAARCRCRSARPSGPRASACWWTAMACRGWSTACARNDAALSRNMETEMRKLRIMEHISLDGVIQASGEDGFPYADWTAPYRTPAGRDELFAAHGGRFDLLLGRRTYDMWSGFWPKAPSSPMADALNAATKHVATHRPEGLAWGPFAGLGPDL